MKYNVEKHLMLIHSKLSFEVLKLFDENTSKIWVKLSDVDFNTVGRMILSHTAIAVRCSRGGYRICNIAAAIAAAVCNLNSCCELKIDVNEGNCKVGMGQQQ